MSSETEVPENVSNHSAEPDKGGWFVVTALLAVIIAGIGYGVTYGSAHYVFSWIALAAIWVFLLSWLTCAVRSDLRGTGKYACVWFITLLVVGACVGTPLLMKAHDNSLTTTPVRVVTASHAKRSTRPTVFLNVPFNATVGKSIVVTAFVVSSSGAPLANTEVDFQLGAPARPDFTSTGSGSGNGPGTAGTAVFQDAETNDFGVATLRLNYSVQSLCSMVWVTGVSSAAYTSNWSRNVNTYYLERLTRNEIPDFKYLPVQTPTGASTTRVWALSQGGGDFLCVAAAPGK